jgi:hypothetical protein
VVAGNWAEIESSSNFEGPAHPPPHVTAGRLMINRHGGGSSTLCRPLRRNWDDRRYVCYPLANSGARLSFYRSRSAAIKQMQHIIRFSFRTRTKLSRATHSGGTRGDDSFHCQSSSADRPIDILKHRSHPSVSTLRVVVKLDRNHTSNSQQPRFASPDSRGGQRT